MSVLLAVAGAVLFVLAIAAYLVGLCFKSRKVRKGIMIGTVAVYVLVATCYLEPIHWNSAHLWQNIF